MIPRKLIASFLLAMVTGCMTHSHQSAPATQPATVMNPATTQPSYWIDQPATSSVAGNDFAKLADACEQTARDYFFPIDRIDYRNGVITTRPVASAQWFEPWRRDARTKYDVEESSIATIRRTIRFEFARTADGWEVSPKVLVERESLAEKRITSVVLYRSVFVGIGGPKHQEVGSAERDQGYAFSGLYWYPLRRDPIFEDVLARAMSEHLAREVEHQAR